ncbi:MAG: hypothetical protein WCE75_03585, partial [Terracidiphilus sp.]
AQYFPGAETADEATGHPWQQLRGDRFTLETLDPADASHLPELGRALAQAQARSGLAPTAPFTVRAFPSTPAFRDGTLAPGWVAAFAEGNWIGAQPPRTLAARRLLGPVLRHEFLHALVEQQAGPQAPLWLREGLVEFWSADAPAAGPAPSLGLDQLDRALAHPETEAASAAAHLAAAWYAGRLLTRFGREQTLAWLRSGLPASAVATLRP